MNEFVVRTLFPVCDDGSRFVLVVRESRRVRVFRRRAEGSKGVVAGAFYLP